MSLSLVAQWAHPPVGRRMVGDQETAPGPDQGPWSLPPAPQPHITPPLGKAKGISEAGTSAPQPRTPRPPPPQILSHRRGPRHPSPLRPTPGRRSAGQSISPPAAALTTRGKVRKVIPSPCDPMLVAEAGQQRAGDPPSSSAVRPGRLGREAALPAPRQPGEILRSSLCTAVKYSSQGLSF